LREALLKGWRRELRRSTTDITAQLMRRGGKGISATRGSVQFFELGQDLLLLLAKLVAGDEKVRYRDFLERLSLYGLAPQDREEEDVLADVLRSLQLLDKYSDTGEAMYVKHFL
jgi:DNA phosphorothioation-dependent restriction protein DptG